MVFEPLRWDPTIWRNVDFPASADEEQQFFDEETDLPVSLTGKTVTMQVRLYEGAAGVALISLSSATAGPADRIEIVDAANGIFRIRIAKATLGGLPAAPGPVLPPGVSEVKFAYDIVVAGELYVWGFLIVRTGVTV